MKRLLLTALCIPFAFSACKAQSPEPLAIRMARSEIARNPSPAQLDGIEVGKIKWNYTTGLELLAIMDAGAVYGRPDFYDYAARYYDSIVRPDGSIITYKKSNYNLDHVCPGRALFALYDRTGEARYKTALDTLFSQLRTQPRNPDGGFWHKKIYPGQMWLDGLYMAQPFYAEYTRRYVRPNGEQAAQAIYDDIANQFISVAEHTYDPVTGLYRHAYDDSRAMFWCDKTTGQSAHAWCRALGWYAMALVETLQYMQPGDTKGYDKMVAILNHIYEVLPRYADPATGMWYQVLDQPGRSGNYLESTGSAMFVYAILKGVRLGYLPADYAPEARALYEKFVDRFVRENPDGTVSLTDCCAVAGLGGKQMRRGDFDYYISEPVIDNDCKGVGPLIWAAIEYDRSAVAVK